MTRTDQAGPEKARANPTQQGHREAALHGPVGQAEDRGPPLSRAAPRGASPPVAKASVPMRPVHWEKLVGAQLGSSVWASVALDAVPIDLAQTEALFAVPKPAPKPNHGADGGGGGGAARGSAAAVAGGGGVGGGGVPAAAPLHVLSVQRATNVGIFLRKTSKLLSLERLCAAIVSLEASVLEPELLDSVLCNLPAKTWAEEARALRALKHVPPSSLAAPERFCFEMARLPRLRPMLHALRQKHTLPQALERATAALATVATAARQLMDSPSLRLLLGSVLAHGNYLNAGTRRGGARGVKLEALEKARGVKSADGQHTLLEHACATCGLWRHTLTSELGGVRAACKKSCKLPLLDVIRITIQELEEGVNSVAQEIALCPDLDADVAADASAPPPKRDGGEPSEEERQVALRFRSAMAPFHTDMRRGLDALTAHRDETKTLLKRLAAWLGEDPNRANPNSILKVCADLIDTAIACARVSAEEHKE